MEVVVPDGRCSLLAPCRSAMALVTVGLAHSRPDISILLVVMVA